MSLPTSPPGASRGHRSLNQGRALVTYGWARTAYHAIRSLSEAGIACSVIDSGRIGMSQQSRLPQRRYIARPFYKDPTGYVLDVGAALDASGSGFLLPVHDDTEVIARHRAMLPPGLIVPIPHLSSIELANDKLMSARAAERASLPVPPYFALHEDWSGDEPTIPWRGKSVVKARRGNSAKGVLYSDSGHIADVASEAIRRFALQPSRYPMIQKCVEGTGCGVACLFWEGEFVASFAHRRLREKMATGGTSTLRETWHAPEVEGLAVALLKSLGWHGLAMVEFKFDQKTRTPWFIEINPRLWGSLALPIAAGVDFPRLLYLCATAGPNTARAQLPATPRMTRMRWYLGDCLLGAGALARGHLREASSLLLPRSGECTDDLIADDPAAFIGELLRYSATFLRTRSRNPIDEGMVS